MNRNILGTALIVPVMGFTLAGCAGLSNLHITGCSNGKCATANVNTSAPDAPSTAPPVRVTTTAPAVNSTTTVTATPSDTPTTTVALGPCDVSLQQSDMEALATSEATRENLMTCMQIPQANQPAMDQWLAQYALSALNSGDFRTQDGRRRWADSQLSGAYHQWG